MGFAGFLADVAASAFARLFFEIRFRAPPLFQSNGQPRRHAFRARTDNCQRMLMRTAQQAAVNATFVDVRYLRASNAG